MRLGVGPGGNRPPVGGNRVVGRLFGLSAGNEGIPRMLAVFENEGIDTSWYVPGHTLETFCEEILTAEETPVYDDRSAVDGLERKVVSYRGQRYETSPVFVSDCPRSWQFFQFVGALGAFLGAVLVGTSYGWRRLRG